MKKVLSLVLTVAMLFSTFYCLTFIVSAASYDDVESLSFLPAEPITLVEGQDGIDWDTYYEYNLSVSDLCQEGNIFRINYSNGTNLDYIYDTSYEDFYDAAGNCLDIWNNWFLYSDQSEENQWTAGEHYFTLYDESYNISTRIPVTIKDNPVKSISYTPVASIEIIEKVDGYWTESYIYDTDTDTEECVEWYVYSFSPKTGDILTVNYTDGTSVDYVYDVYSGDYTDSNGNNISDYYVKRSSNQSYKNNWTEPGEYSFDLYYMGAKTEVLVTLVENPVKSISCTLDEPIELIENINGYWTGYWKYDENTDEEIYKELFWYYFGSSLNDISKYISSFIVDYQDGTRKVFVMNNPNCSGLMDGDYSTDDGEVLSFGIDTNQYDKPWVVDGDNYILIEAYGKILEIPVTIAENSVASISYTPAKSVELIENADGYWSGNWLWNEEDFTEEYVEWFEYDTGVYDIFKDGDIITVTYKDGIVTDYVCRVDYYNDCAVFLDEEGNELPCGNEYDITYFSNNQSYENQWTVGNEYELTFNYLGRQTTVPVKIVEGPVESIAFIPAKPIELVQGVDGYGDDLRDYFSYYYRYELVGNTITVNYQDGTSKDFVYKATENSFWWVSDDGEKLDWEYLYARSDQYKNNWTEPGEYSFDLYYMGAKTEVPVTVIENNVESISVELAEPIEYTWRPDVADNPSGTFYYVSDEILQEDGNKIILHYNDGSTKEYTWSSEAYSIYQEGWCDSDNNLLHQRVRVTDDQYENPWEIGDDNYVIIECMNRTKKVPVTLVACEHSWTSEGCYRKEPTCTEVGYQSEVCINCGSCRKTELPASGHNYSTEWTIDKQATCTSSGSKSHHCTRCDAKVDITTISETGHSYGDWVVSLEAYCSEAGLKTKTCSVCGGVETETITELGHNYSTEWTIDKFATCTEDGSKSHHCSRCDSVADVTVISAEGHSASDWITDEDSTCAVTGSKHKECTVCGDVLETEAIAKKNHTAGNWITDKKATVNAAGSKHKECTECGEVLETATIKQLKCSKPKLSKIENTADGVKITWSKVSGADKYYVYRKVKGGSYSKIATTTKTYYTDKKASSGKKYYYIVKAVNEAGNSDSSSSKSILHLSDPTLKTPSSTKKGIVLKWNKITGAQGYVVYRKTGSGSYKKIATVKGNSKITYTDKSAKKGKKYTYKVKAYYSKTYSAYSNTKTIKDKY